MIQNFVGQLGLPGFQKVFTMEKVNLNAEFSEDGTYIRKNSLPTKKVKPVEVKEPVEVQEVQKPLNVKFISDNEFYLNPFSTDTLKLDSTILLSPSHPKPAVISYPSL